MGIREAISPMRSLFMYPGYLSVAVLVAMMVDTCTYTYTGSYIGKKQSLIQIYTHKLVYLCEGRVGNMQSFCGNPVHGSVIKNNLGGVRTGLSNTPHGNSQCGTHNTVCVQSQSLHGENGVIGLDHHITNAVLLIKVREHRICLYQLLRVPTYV